MSIDNLVSNHTIKEVDRSGFPLLVEITINGTAAAASLLDRLFTGDDVTWMGATWRVWAIDGNVLTLIRK